MPEKKVLSICIPTFKRAKALDKTLGDLEREIAPVKNDVEICVSDNCSPDDTQAVLKKWEKRLPLVHGRNERNLGYDVNALRVMQLANATYAWFIGDDDEILPGTVKRLMDDIRAGRGRQMGVIFLNQFEGNNAVVHFDFSDFRVFRKDEMRYPLNISFGGSVCLNTDIAGRVIAKIRELDDRLALGGHDEPILHGFVHSFLFLECMKEGGYIGIEPTYGMKFMASGEKTTYQKKVYVELIMARYYLEIKMRYPWFQNFRIYNLKGYWKRFFSVGAVAAEKPDLEYAYRTLYRLYIKILESEGRGAETMLSKIFEGLRGFGPWRFFLIKLHHMVRKNENLELEFEDDKATEIEKNMRLMVASLEKML